MRALCEQATGAFSPGWDHRACLVWQYHAVSIAGFKEKVIGELCFVLCQAASGCPLPSYTIQEVD